jgi:hypothetical protein
MSAKVPNNTIHYNIIGANMSIVSRYHTCLLEVWVLSEPNRRPAGPVFLNVFRQPITTCPRCGQPLALEDLQEARVTESVAAGPAEQAQPESVLHLAYTT